MQFTVTIYFKSEQKHGCPKTNVMEMNESNHSLGHHPANGWRQAEL